MSDIIQLIAETIENILDNSSKKDKKKILNNMLKKRLHTINKINEESEIKKQNIIKNMEKTLKNIFLEEEIKESPKSNKSLTEDRNIRRIRRSEITEDDSLNNGNLLDSMMKLSI